MRAKIKVKEIDRIQVVSKCGNMLESRIVIRVDHLVRVRDGQLVKFWGYRFVPPVPQAYPSKPSSCSRLPHQMMYLRPSNSAAATGTSMPCSHK